MNSPSQIDPERLLSILFYSPNATAVYTGDDINIISVNQAMLQLWGKDRSVVGQTFHLALPELHDQPFLEILKNVWNSGETFVARNFPAVLEIDGFLKKSYFDFEYKAVKDDNGKTEYILHTAFEVTERQEAEQLVEEKSRSEQKLINDLSALNEEYMATNDDLVSKHEELFASNNQLEQTKNELLTVNYTLIESEERFKTLVERSPVAMASLKGENFEIEIANDMVLKIWNKDHAVIGLPLEKALPELEGQPFIDILKKVYATGEPYHGLEDRALIADQGKLVERYLNFVYQPIFDEQRKNISILIVANDVTEQVNARRSVTEINNRLEIALDASKLGSTEVELSTGMMTSNAQFKYNYGFLPHEEFNYPDLFEAMLPEYRESVKALVQEAIRTNGIYKAEYPVKWKDGSIHWIQAHGRPRYDDNGIANRMVGMTADITEKKLAEQRKDDFLSVASHELKTPLTAVRGSIQLLNRIKDRPYSSMHEKLIEQSENSIEKMCMLVDELLNMSKMGQDDLDLSYSLFNIYDMLSSSCSHIRFEDGYQIHLSGDEKLEVFADLNRIEQVVINFVNNAVKYGKNSKNIFLLVEDKGEDIKVSVKDLGLGIPESALPFIFERYYRADHLGRSYSGLGLGLYICSEIIKKHSGKIGVESKMGEGSNFWFTLPKKI
ncbi:PAS domain S-box protein [Chryseobacterium sp. LC2016-27]|uniref:PAS domain-containing sensor histidine kinase n=1 Tax=Chryseobacterium sp. LC2016-27 TaxID=2897326 RepID=UPI001E5E5A5D|nr:PAS domain-containing sensor histidine kinase [Chryseobacterium sp. LC2016-27]MCD0456412.1 PAS domain S-box protein [Chryseobacterium sp. LC2016-27]